MAWLFYLFSFPGVLIGLLLAAFIGKFSSRHWSALIAFGLVFLGIALNLVVVFLVAA